MGTSDPAAADGPPPPEEMSGGSIDADSDIAERVRPWWKRILLGVGVAFAVVVAAVVVMAVWPASTGGLDADPDPTATFETAVDRYETLTAGEPGVVYEPCRSRLLHHGERTEVAVVLFHGLTNCPRQFVELAEELHDDGANVLILRAPRHGIANDDGDAIGGLSNIGGLDAEELRDYADDAVDVAVGLGEEVRVLGLSMGGVLAEWTAQHRSDVDRVVAVAPAMSIPGVPGFLTTAFINLFDKLPDIDLPGESNLDHAYVGESTEGLVATFLLARSVEEAASERAPAAGEVIVVVNPDDNQVSPGYVTGFAEDWNERSGNVEIVQLPAVGLPHDVIDVGQPDGDPELVYPILLELLDQGA